MQSSINQEDKVLRCNHIDHQLKEIQGACVFNKCQSHRLYCNICMKSLHSDHVKELLDFPDLEQWLNKQATLQQSLKQLIDEIHFICSMLLDYCFPSLFQSNQNLNELTLNQLNDKVNLALRFSTLDTSFRHNVEKSQQFLMTLRNQLKGIVSSDQLLHLNHFENNSLMLTSNCSSETRPKEKIQICKLPIKFSSFLKPKEILVSTKGNVARNNGYIGFVVCEPQIPQQGITRFAFKILKCAGGGGIGVGLCQKDLLMSTKYRPDLRNISHGVYLLDKAGWIYSHSEKEMNCVSTSLLFTVNDVIIVEVNYSNSKMTFLKKQSAETICLNFDSSVGLYPCVELAWGQIEILQDF